MSRQSRLALTFSDHRRRAEVINPKAGNIAVEDGVAFWYRGKGGGHRRRQLPRPAFEAIGVSLARAGSDPLTSAVRARGLPSASSDARFGLAPG